MTDDKRQAWTQEPWITFPRPLDDSGGWSVPILTKDLDEVGIATSFKRRPAETNANAIRIVACVNALSDIPDPAAWREAVERLVEAAEHACSYREEYARDDLSDAIESVLALQSPPEERDDG